MFIFDENAEGSNRYTCIKFYTGFSSATERAILLLISN